MELVDATEPVLGVRAWQARSDGRLCSLHWPAKWEPGVNRARLSEASSCRDPSEVPAATCGLYGSPDLNHRDPAATQRVDVVVGTIAAWGRLEPESDGFRAEYARILAIGDSGASNRLERRAATRYDVPLVPFAELERFSRQHAGTLRLERQTHGALIVVVDCGPEAAARLAEIRCGLSRLVQRRSEWRIDLVACGQGAFVVPLGGEAAERCVQLERAIQMLVPADSGPALARGLERARGRVLWANRRFSTTVLMVACAAPDAETRCQLQQARRDGVATLTVCPTPAGGWDRCLGEHIPMRPGAWELTEAIRDAVGRLEVREDHWPAEWTRREVALPRAGLHGVVGVG